MPDTISPGAVARLNTSENPIEKVTEEDVPAFVSKLLVEKRIARLDMYGFQVVCRSLGVDPSVIKRSVQFYRDLPVDVGMSGGNQLLRVFLNIRAREREETPQFEAIIETETWGPLMFVASHVPYYPREFMVELHALQEVTDVHQVQATETELMAA